MNILDIVCLPNSNMRLSDLAYQYAFSPPSARAQPWNCTHAPNSAAPKTLVQPHPNSHPLKQSDRLRTFSARVLELTSSRCRSLSHGGRVLSLSLSLSLCVCACVHLLMSWKGIIQLNTRCLLRVYRGKELILTSSAQDRAAESAAISR